MFSTKIKWVRLADSKEELESLLMGREIHSLRVNGKDVILIKQEDEFFLMRNKCPHQGIKLNDASCADGKIVCPWHHYGFDLKTGRGGGLYLENYPIEFRKDAIYAGFEYFSWF